MATISKRVTASGAVSWRVQIRVKGRPALSETFPRKTDAVRWAEQNEADLRRDMLLPEVAGRRLLGGGRRADEREQDRGGPLAAWTAPGGCRAVAAQRLGAGCHGCGRMPWAGLRPWRTAATL